MPRIRKWTGGFSLLEVLIAVFIIGVVVQVANQVQQATWTGTRNNGNMLAATRLIGSAIEQTRANIMYAPTLFWPPRDTSYTDISGIAMAWAVTGTTDKKGVTCDSLRQIDYTARWSAGGRPDSVTLTTFMSYDF